MTRHYCDKCKREITAREARFSLEMIGKELCSKHTREYLEKHGNNIWKYEKKEDD